ncbi:nucleosidase [Streptomyces minutiscleroticus]|uniref:Nucleosidase n=1 Tax=Streptomyces minutiscleroticus TaxID=68238 RepID=A0A918NRL4_9ACTN|nr:nucleosidase [Streptomyces minutiscleroticus]GGX89472.1 nucleosidase [Streptomyces minutiscleroticus]
MITTPPAGRVPAGRLLGEIRPDRPLVVAAVEEEAAHLGTGLPVLITGMGKINATAALTLALAGGARPREVVNLGTAGALKDGLRGVLEVSRVLQHDFDTALLHAISGRTYGAPIDLSDGPGHTLATGDTFVSDTAVRARLAEEAQLVDMEGYAVADTARRFGVPVRLVKYVSDTADESAPTAWPEAVDLGARQLAAWARDHLR